MILKLSLLVPFEWISVCNKPNCVNGILFHLIRPVKRFYQFSILSTSKLVGMSHVHVVNKYPLLHDET